MISTMIKNARIRSTMFGRENRGIMTFMTFMIYIEFDKSMTCGIGGWTLDEYSPTTKTRLFKTESMEVISKILDVVGVDKWEDLPGKYIRFEDRGWGSTIDKIGNIIEDKWLDLREFFEEIDVKENGKIE